MCLIHKRHATPVAMLQNKKRIDKSSCIVELDGKNTGNKKQWDRSIAKKSLRDGVPNSESKRDEEKRGQAKRVKSKSSHSRAGPSGVPAVPPATAPRPDLG